MDRPFADTLFHLLDTACNEQTLNSIIVKPAQGETISLAKLSKSGSCRVQGIAYDGGGHQVQRVEVSLDDGKSWLYCIRTFPEAPIRHGNKYWAWIHWHVDVKMQHHGPPKDYNWNIMGMMNNAWYSVKPEIAQDETSGETQILFRHPVEPGQGTGGWMKSRESNRKGKVGGRRAQKEFTRGEIEKHAEQDDCWIVVDGNDKHTITNAAGKALQDGSGTFDLTVKSYLADESQPGGAMSSILGCIPLGEEVEVRGPTGDITYHSHGVFTIESQEHTFKRVSLVLGGSGITPGYALIARIAMAAGDDRTEVRVIDANKTEKDNLMRSDLDEFEKNAKGQIKISHVLSHPGGEDWNGLKGHVDEDVIMKTLFPPEEDSVVFLRGPPVMVQQAALPALKYKLFTRFFLLFF